MVRKNRIRAALVVTAVLVTACGESSNSGSADQGTADAGGMMTQDDVQKIVEYERSLAQ